MKTYSEPPVTIESDSGSAESILGGGSETNRPLKSPADASLSLGLSVPNGAITKAIAQAVGEAVLAGDVARALAIVEELGARQDALKAEEKRTVLKAEVVPLADARRVLRGGKLMKRDGHRLGRTGSCRRSFVLARLAEAPGPSQHAPYSTRRKHERPGGSSAGRGKVRGGQRLPPSRVQ